ncbi:hypothetical protein H4R19_001051 [Coemansia spiralis]|nr:hypothetical protein H4R19_001051 [Coemansia spiralis]
MSGPLLDDDDGQSTVRVLGARAGKRRIQVALALMAALCLGGWWLARTRTVNTQPSPHAADGGAGCLCSQLPVPDTYWQLLSTADDRAFVEIPSTATIGPGGSVCVRVVVPPRPSGHDESMVHMPPAGAPWDSILLDMVGARTGISVPVALRAVAHVDNYHRSTTHIYEADVLLRDADTYHPDGYIEFRDAVWNAEGNNTVPLFAPEALVIPESLNVTVADPHGTSPYSLQRHLDLPLCTRMDAEGRWVRNADLPFSNAEVLPSDHHGLVWLPYHCRLQRYTHEAFAQCLTQKHRLVHWFGDSNTRRALKKITTLGQWCSDPHDRATSECRCEDYNQPDTRFSEHAREAIIDMDPVVGGVGRVPEWLAPADPVPANGSRIVVFKTEGLTYLNRPAWHRRFDVGIIEWFGVPNTVVVSLVNWDAAFMTMNTFAIELDKFLARLQAAYPPTVDIIIRTGQHYCCRADTSRLGRKFSRLRVALMNDYVAQRARARLGPHRSIRVWDVAMVTERRPYIARAESRKCSSNHARSEIVDVENQVLFNGLCN